jgi:hypothetical protein
VSEGSGSECNSGGDCRRWGDHSSASSDERQNMDYVVLETEDGEGSGSECNSGGDCRRRVGFFFNFYSIAT